MRRIRDSIEVLAPVEHVYRFCTNVSNLPRVFPKEVKVELVRQPELPLKQGADIVLRFHRAGLAYPWESVVTALEPCVFFEDLQTRGPMKRWISRHAFEETPRGTRIHHAIDYEFHFGMIGRFCGLMILDGLLRRIFRDVHHATKWVAEEDWRALSRA